MQRQPTPVTLVSADARLIHLAQASAAAAAAPLLVVDEAPDVRATWRTAPAVLIGADQVSQLVAWALPPRSQLYLLGQADAYETLCRWSMPLGASVIVVPDGAKWLSRVLSGRARGSVAGTVVAVRGGCGGVGASTLCAGLAVAAARQAHSVALVDGDPCGGGLDLLLGAENLPGWRWDKLSNAVGQIADITPMLPRVEDVTLVSMPRADPLIVPSLAYEAVIDCLARSHDLVLVDAGRMIRDGPALTTRAVILSGLTVRSVAATRAVLNGVDTTEYGLVVRRRGSVTPGDAGRAIELPLVGVLPDLPELGRLADRGVAPMLGGKWKRACSQILRWCLADSSADRRPS